MSASRFLVRGLLAGLLAGIAAFGVAYVIGEPSVTAAIALEESVPADQATHSHQDQTAPTATGDGAVIPRSLQSTLGLLTATVVAGVTLGGLFGVLGGIALGRFGSVSVRATMLGATAAGFVTLYGVPFLAYPPNPPGVGSGDTIEARTASYFLLVAISVLAAVVAVLAGRSLHPRIGGWYAWLTGLAAYLVLSLAAVALMPHFDEVPARFPATVLYDFRTASFIIQLSLWTVLGLALAELVHRLLVGSAAPGRNDHVKA
ncbi:MAG TPA: CbtA family protein [Propionibacteriaceae bacterium]|nr:CbtA family protein [Propionibacteriaceae bacterium]